MFLSNVYEYKEYSNNIFIFCLFSSVNFWYFLFLINSSLVNAIVYFVKTSFSSIFLKILFNVKLGVSLLVLCDDAVFSFSFIADDLEISNK